MKWKNAIELPNNPYSAEALQRRLSQTSVSKFDKDIERLAVKLQKDDKETVTKSNLPKIDKPCKKFSGENMLDSGRYYYLNGFNKCILNLLLYISDMSEIII